MAGKKKTNFDVSDYIEENQNPMLDSNFANMEGAEDYYIKTECYYLIKYEQVFGTLVLRKDCMVFEPSTDLDHNKHL
jgi:hypothetical protein